MKRIIFNPAERIAGTKSLLVGLWIIVLTSLFADIFNTHFNGVIDIKYGAPDTVYLSYLLYGLVNVIVLSVLLYISGIIVSKSSIRFIDVIGTQSIARAPFIFAPFFNVASLMEKAGNQIMYLYMNIGEPVIITPFQWIIVALFLLFSLLIIVWAIALMYNSYRVTCNVKGSKAVISFIIVLLIAEGLTLWLNSIHLKILNP